MLKKFITVKLLLLAISHNLFAQNQDYEMALKLINAYPNHLQSYKDNYIIWKDGDKMIFDDYIKKNDYQDLLNNASLKEQLTQKYIKIKDNKTHIPTLNEDPGRIRHQDFFKKMYGYSEEEIKKNLTKIKWMPNSSNKTIMVTTINSVHKKLQAISSELEQLAPNLKKYVNNPSGGYNFRKIANTNRLSMHSFGLAIDINVDKSHYWLWDKQKNNFSYKNLIPFEIVKIFEKHSFIWGGRWYHYDTMHFEYRPELLN